MMQRIYVEGIENKDPKVLKKAQAFAKSLNCNGV